MELRTYLYRDDRRIGEFLEQLQAGLVGETTVTSEDVHSADGGINAGVAKADLGTTTKKSTAFTLAPTPVSRAQQFETRTAEVVVDLTKIAPDELDDIKRGSLVSFTGTLEVPDTIRKAMATASMGQLASVMAAFDYEDDRLDKAVDQFEAVKRLLEMDGFPILAKADRSALNILLIAEMDLIVGKPLSLNDVDVTVLGRLKRTVSLTDTVEQNELLPSLSAHLQPVNREQRRKAGSKAPQPIKVKGPAAFVDPIMIYE